VGEAVAVGVIGPGVGAAKAAVAVEAVEVVVAIVLGGTIADVFAADEALHIVVAEHEAVVADAHGAGVAVLVVRDLMRGAVGPGPAGYTAKRAVSDVVEDGAAVLAEAFNTALAVVGIADDHAAGVGNLGELALAVVLV